MILLAGLIIIGQYKAITAQNGFNRRISDECQEAQDNQFLGFLAFKCPFLSSGTMKIGSGRSNLYIGRWSRGCLTPQIARTKPFSLQGPCKEPPGPLKQTLLDLQDHQNHLQDHQNHPHVQVKNKSYWVASRGLSLVSVESRGSRHEPSEVLR